MQNQSNSTDALQSDGCRKVFRPEDFGGDKEATFAAAIKYAKDQTAEKPEYQVRPSERITFLYEVCNKSYPGTKVILVNCVWQLFERIGRILSNCEDAGAFFDRRTGEIIIVLDQMKNKIDCILRMQLPILRLNLGQYIKDNNLTREQFFGTGNETEQIRMEDQLMLFRLGGATWFDKKEVWVRGLFKEGGQERFVFREAECKILIDKLNLITKNRNPQGGYVKYIPIRGPEELL
jgi:hypothetical protein